MYHEIAGVGYATTRHIDVRDRRLERLGTGNQRRSAVPPRSRGLLPSPRDIALRKLPGAVVGAAAPPAAAVREHLRVLPLVRRPGRRSGRSRARPRTAAVVAGRARRVLRGAAAASGVRGTRADDR